MKTTVILMVCLCISAFVTGQNKNEEKNPLETVIQLTTVTKENPLSITLKWNPIPEKSDFRIYRKSKYSSTWGSPIAVLNCDSTEFTDWDIKAGNEYEYAVKTGYYGLIETYANAGIK